MRSLIVLRPVTWLKVRGRALARMERWQHSSEERKGMPMTLKWTE
jgi:hypothetical protein